MKQLLALLLFVPSLCIAQLPDYVPTTDLVIWLDFEESDPTSCSTGTSLECEDYYSFGTDRLGGNALITGNSCFHLPGVQSVNSDWTFSCWIKAGPPPSSIGNLFREHWDEGNWLRFEPNPTTLEFRHGVSEVVFDNSPAAEGLLDNQWHHIVAVSASDHASIYGDGQLLASGAPAPLIEWNEPFLIGSALPPGSSLGSGCAERLNGQMDDIGIWNHALDSSEVLALFLGNPLEYGCIDATACNYDEAANADDGSCTYGCLYCGGNTVWDSTLQECVGVIPPADSILVPIPSCGEGTVWDPVNEECIVAISTDTDFDGCVTAGDVLNLLATFGTCPPLPEWPDAPADTTWTCGDPLTYWDYAYATVLIGDQCWFAENLRTETYDNGDPLPSGLSDGDWTSTNVGATAVYGEGNSNCTETSPVLDACDEGASLAAFGRLYNWFAVDDSRNLCPTQWHVPTDSDWMDLEVSSGMDPVDANNTGWRGTDEGLKLKSSTGWNNGGNGQDGLGFNARPAGGRHPLEGRFLAAGEGGYFWTSTPDGSSAWIRRLKSDYSQIDRWPYNLRNGYSVRCVKD